MIKLLKNIKKINRTYLVLFFLIAALLASTNLNSQYFQGFTKIAETNSKIRNLKKQQQNLERELKQIQSTDPKNTKKIKEIKDQLKQSNLLIKKFNDSQNQLISQRITFNVPTNQCEYDIDNDGIDNALDNCPSTYNPRQNNACSDMAFFIQNQNNQTKVKIAAQCYPNEQVDCQIEIQNIAKQQECPNNGDYRAGTCVYNIPKGTEKIIQQEFPISNKRLISIQGKISELKFEGSDITEVLRLGDLGLKDTATLFNNIQTLKSISGEANLSNTVVNPFISGSSIESLDASNWRINPQTTFFLSLELAENLKHINFSNLNFTGINNINLRSGHLRNIQSIFLVNITNPTPLFSALNEPARPATNIVLGATNYRNVILDANGNRRFFQEDTLYCNTIDSDGNSINQGLDCLPMSFLDANNNGYEDNLEACGRTQSPLRNASLECNFDTDQDSIDDKIDNCPFTFNPNQEDSDQDNMGDACEDMLFDLDGSTDQNLSPNAILNFYVRCYDFQNGCNFTIDFKDDSEECPGRGNFRNGICEYNRYRGGRIQKEYSRPFVEDISIKGTLHQITFFDSDLISVKRLGDLGLQNELRMLRRSSGTSQLNNLQGEFKFENLNTLEEILGETQIRDLNIYHWDISHLNSLRYSFALIQNLDRVNLSTWNFKSDINTDYTLLYSNINDLFLQNINFNDNINTIKKLIDGAQITNLYLKQTNLSELSEYIQNNRRLQNTTFYCDTRDQNNIPINLGIPCQPMPFNDLNFNAIDDDQEAACLSPDDLDMDQDGTRDADDNCPDISNPEQTDLDNDNIGDDCDPDIDNDGLENEEELIFGTDPNNPDTDNDGLLDGQEKEIGTDPNNSDSDEDGISDGTEGALDTDNDGVVNPLDLDSDNDGLPDEVETTADTDRDGTPNYLDTDSDNDTILDSQDNCQLIQNQNQLNQDEDELGDACDSDNDNDGVENESDNCPTVANPDQTNSDSDRQGDACDDDSDNDGLIDSNDNCPTNSNPNQEDIDEDNIGDVCDPDKDGDNLNNEQDNCPTVSNPNQADLDQDGQGDACDADVDGDGVNNNRDNCEFINNPDQRNVDRDEFGDACDTDIDNDGLENNDDNCQLIPNQYQEDQDADGQGDVCDPDIDGDGVNNGPDNCATTINPNQEDLDNDNIGDVCDDDMDGDEVINEDDNCPQTPNSSQSNRDGDQYGDACDDDIDADGIANENDNCPLINNPRLANGLQRDRDQDGIGDPCDIDLDGDGIDNGLHPRQDLNSPDNCPYNSNPNQADLDDDNIGDICDQDMDGDGVLNIPAYDNCPYNENPDQEDIDDDNIGDVCDPDMDGDGIANNQDTCPTVSGTDQGCPSIDNLHLVTDRPTELAIHVIPYVRADDPSINSRNLFRSRNTYLQPQEHQVLFNSQNTDSILCYFGSFLDYNVTPAFRSYYSNEFEYLHSFYNLEYLTTYAVPARQTPGNYTYLPCRLEPNLTNYQNIEWKKHGGESIMFRNTANESLQFKIKKTENYSLPFVTNTSYENPKFILSFNQGSLKLTDECHNQDQASIRIGDYYLINSKETSGQEYRQENQATLQELSDPFNTLLYNPNYAFKIVSENQDYINIEITETQNIVNCNQ